MGQLKKATLQAVDAEDKAVGPAVSVQFNPTTLRLQFQHNYSNDTSQKSGARQYLGTSSSTLTLDLIFDTADDGTTDEPRSVREKTAIVERFVLPSASSDGSVPPNRVRFEWKDIIVVGVVQGTVTLDYELFASDGTPLRAKASLTIQEQSIKFMKLAAGPGAKRTRATAQPGGIGLGGTIGITAGVSAQASLALGGESAAEFAARVGVDPAAWRGLALSGENHSCPKQLMTLGHPKV